MSKDLDKLARRLSMCNVWNDLKELIKRLKIAELVLENDDISKEDKKRIIQIVLEKFPDRYIEFLKKLFEFLEDKDEKIC